MYEKLRSKKDARLYFTFCRDTNWSLGEVKSELIRMNYINHVEGDRYVILKKWNLEDVRKELENRLN